MNVSTIEAIGLGALNIDNICQVDRIPGDAEKEYVVEPVDKSIISASDTTGAGDAFATGFLYGLLNGKQLDTYRRLGDIVARFSIARTGARQGLPTIEEPSQRYLQLYNKPL